MPVSEKQRIANLLNAQKSTGPRSADGKARSRRNALKHGLTGSGACLLDIARHEVEAELIAFAEVYKPQDAVERRFVEQAALASVRHNRAQTQSEAMTQARCRDAVRQHDERRDAEVAAAMARLDDDPAGALAVLRASSEGCDALEDAWHELAKILEVIGYWSDRQADRALRLLGRSERPTIDDEPSLAALWLHVLAARRESERLKIARYCGAMSLDLPDADEARSALARLAEGEVGRWKGRGESLWDGTDGPARAGAVNAALIDTGGEGQKLVRYQSKAAADMRQSVKALESHRRERRRAEKEEDRRAREGHRAQNEPISAGRIGTESSVRERLMPNGPSAPTPSTAPDPGPSPIATTAPGAADGTPRGVEAPGMGELSPMR